MRKILSVAVVVAGVLVGCGSSAPDVTPAEVEAAALCVKNVNESEGLTLEEFEAATQVCRDRYPEVFEEAEKRLPEGKGSSND